MEACTIKKVIRKNPVNPIKYFFPIEEVNSCFQVINQKIKNFRWHKGNTGNPHLLICAQVLVLFSYYFVTINVL